MILILMRVSLPSKLWKNKTKKLVTKVNEADVISYVKSFDILCATEKFTSTLFDFSKHFENHHALPSLAIKLSARGRRSGGAAVFIDRSSMPFVTPIECSYDDVTGIKISEAAVWAG